MKHYPSIPSQILRRDISVNVYDKIDGSNIRVEWKRKQGKKRGHFYKFGSRKQLLTTEQGVITKAPALLEEGMGEQLERYLIDMAHADRCILYFEFYGDRSFAGIHHEDDDHRLVLLDIELYKKGFIHQSEYLRATERYDIDRPAHLRRTTITPEFEQRVRNGELGTFEGVVCKGRTATDKYGKPIMFKIKNQAWIDKVKAVHKGNTKLLADLL